MHTTGVICVELVRKLQDAGARFTEVGVHHYRRVYGKSEFFRLAAIARTLWDLAGLWVQLVVLRRGRSAARVGRLAAATTMTDVPKGTSSWASHPSFGTRPAARTRDRGFDASTSEPASGVTVSAGPVEPAAGRRIRSTPPSTAAGGARNE